MSPLLKNKDWSSVAVIGDGSWATALIRIMTENPIKVKWWVRERENVKYIRRFGYNPDYLTGVSIPKRRVKANHKIEKVVESVEYVIVAVPAAYAKAALDQLPVDAFDGKIVVTAVKGMIPDENLLVTDYIQKRFKVKTENLAIISGPCHAEEVAMGRHSYLTIGSENLVLADRVAKLFACRFVNVACLEDLQGIEYAAVMKNIVALASGITHSLNYGDNFQAVLVSNAMQEIRYFLDHICPKERDLSQSAYLGDLLVTAYSQFSRNRTFGNMIGRGYTIKSAMMEMKMVAEGYYAVNSIYKMVEANDLDMPICKAVYNILYERITPTIEIDILKGRFK